MILSGTTIGFICVFALLLAALTLVILDKREKAKGNLEKSRLLSRTALGLFIVAFVGGVIVTLIGGIQPKDEKDIAAARSQAMGRPGSMVGGTPIGHIDQKEFQQLQEKVASDSNDVASRERLGHLYLQMGDYENVFRMAHEALQVNPNGIESRVHMGVALLAMGRAEKAVEQVDQALEIDPKNPEALLFKGMIQFQGQNDIEGAKKTWNKYLKLAKPDDPGRKKVRMFLHMADSMTESGAN